MASNASVSLTIAHLNFVTQELNRYIPLPLLVLGTIGNILNILVFTRPALRKNPCSFYFVSGSLANFLALYVGLITPFLGLYGLDPTQKFNALCKIRYYLRFSAITLSTWFILFACLDRFLSSSANVRFRLCSSLHTAKRTILIVSIVCFLFPYTQVFHCYSINQKNTCTYINNICKLSIDITLLICNSGVPPIAMVILNVLTIQNVRNLHWIHFHRRRDVQLNRILFIQVIALVLFTTPITAQKLYSSAAMSRTKSDLTTATDSLINQVSTEISYIISSTTFYIYSLTSKRFRREASGIVLSLLCCQQYKTNRVQPVRQKSKRKSNSTMIKFNHQQNRANISSYYENK